MNVYERKKLKGKMEKELAEVGTSICELPRSILADILSRLPIKSVIRCRCVSKSFHSTISTDPEFPPLHLSRSPPELILCPITEHIFFVDHDNDRYHQLNLPRFERSDVPSALNSCRGLICFDLFFSSRSLFVLNPITLEYTLIPPPTHLIEKKKPYMLRFGFGYSPITNTYKALAIINYNNSDNTITAIYTAGAGSPNSKSSYSSSSSSSSGNSGSNSWRIIEDAPLVVFDRTSSPTYINGCLHWLVKRNSTHCVLFFDFDKEEFGEIVMPPPYKAGQENQFETRVAKLVVFEGWLSVCLLMDKKKVDVWAMKEYGVTESWCKEIAVETPDHLWSSGAFPLKYVNNKKEVVLCYLNHDKEEMVLDFMGEKTLVTYNLIEKKIVNLNELPFNNGTLMPLIHVPILLSLKDLIKGAEVHLIARQKWREFKGNWFFNLILKALGESNVDSDSDSDADSESD